jgi:hypothetical protein
MRSGYYRYGHRACRTSELDDYRFVDPGELASYLPSVTSARVEAALRCRGTGTTAYLPWDGP